MRLWMPIRVTPAHGVGGGMERVAWTVAHGLADRGHRVTVVTTSHPAGLVEEQEGHIRIRYLPGSTWRRYQGRWWARSYAMLAEEQRGSPKSRYDVILSQSAGALGYLRPAGQELGLPTVVLLHGSARSELRTAWRGARSLRNPRGLYRLARLGWRLPPLLVRWRRAASAVGHWLAVSPEVAADNGGELGIPSERMTNVPVGVDVDRFRPNPSVRAAERDRLGIPPEAPVLVVLSRLEREKGVDVALEAAQAVRADLPHLRLLIAGGGHDDARLRRRAADLGLGKACAFLGLVEHERVPALMAAGDVFVFPSRCAEARPVSVVEAMAAGLPVVASRSAGTEGLVIDGLTGALTRPGSPKELAYALRRLLADEPVRREMGERGRKEAIAGWSSQAMVDMVEDVLQRVVGAGTG